MRSGGVDETAKIAEDFLNALEGEESAVVVGLRGELGSGKTVFVQAVARALGVTEQVTSPTFVILKRHTLHDLRYATLIHIDAYRLDSGAELMALGWEELIMNPSNLIFIEWPERVTEILPKETRHIEFEFVDNTTREIRFTNSDSRFKNVREL